MNYTTIEQSKKLIELGLNPDTADMYYFTSQDDFTTNNTPRVGFDIEVKRLYDSTLSEYLPCWSVGALLEIIRYHEECNFLDLHTNEACKWRISTSYYDYIWKEHNIVNMSLLEAAYNMIVWLLQNSYIKTE